MVARGWQYGLCAEQQRCPTKRLAENRIDTTGEALKEALGSGISWDPLTGSQLIIDFDNGNRANDALGMLLGLNDTGLGAAEGMIAPGTAAAPPLSTTKWPVFLPMWPPSAVMGKTLM
ncbi:hypothetical protein HORIV_21120 [Vreelandella olivaria]|uniref:Uncharacterized protein n=1 Tax=Vreelandella olivaria TaxID=390919 RepID=A0ABM7GGE7_9GAMM|nr:hypothetical protein HORIV_21120 [Halomonas olivaria]